MFLPLGNFVSRQTESKVLGITSVSWTVHINSWIARLKAVVGERVSRGEVEQAVTENGENKSISLKFAVISDSHGDTQSFPQVLGRIREDKVDFFIHLGDIANAGEEEMLKQAKKLMNEVGIEYYLIPGDHDYNWQPQHNLANFVLVFGNKGVVCAPCGYGIRAFNRQEASFVLMDNSQNTNDVLLGELESILIELDSGQPMFIFTSKPLASSYFPDKMDVTGEKVLEVLRKYPVKQIFSGDTHVFARYPDPQYGVEITTVGATGSYKNPLAQYVLVTLYQDNSFKIEAKPYKRIEK